MWFIILALSICSCQAVTANCPRPPLENGFFVPHLEIYEHRVTISYGCDIEWKLALKKWWGQITCTDGTWSPTPQCINKTWCFTPHVPHTKSVNGLESFYPSGKVVAFQCNSGYEADGGKLDTEARCLDGKWSVPACEIKSSSCVPPPRVENGMIKQDYKDVFEHGEKLEYFCAKGYKLKGDEYINTCQYGRWENKIECEKKTCSYPNVQNGISLQRLKNTYNIGDHVEFTCRSSYEFEGTTFAECVDGSWRLPVCKPRREPVCDAPRVANAVPVGLLAPPYPSGRSVQFTCNKGYDFEETHYAFCENGRWKLPVCKQKKTCSYPNVQNGISLQRLKNTYNIGDHVEFKCRSSYEFEGTTFAECVDGSWRLPVCKPRREPVCDAPRVANAVPVGLLAPPYPSRRSVQFTCNKGYDFEETHYAFCENGRWQLPVCKLVGNRRGPETSMVTSSVRDCGDQPLIENGDVSEIQGDGQLKVLCKAFFKLQGPAKVSCVAGQWTELPVCKAPCKLDKTRFLSSYYNDDYLPEGEIKSFYCDSYYSYTIQISCRNGQLRYSTCSYH